MSHGTKLKLFISHASEDKPDLVEPLAQALSPYFDVWYDKDSIVDGDALMHTIGSALANTDYGVAVFSPHYFRKKWPQDELGGLYALETIERRTIIPIWKGVNEEDIKRWNPMFLDRRGINGSQTIPDIVEAIRMATGISTRSASVSASSNHISRYTALVHEIKGRQRADTLMTSQEGFEIYMKETLIIRQELITFAEQSASLPEDYRLVPENKERVLAIRAAYQHVLSVIFWHDAAAVSHCHLDAGVYRQKNNYEPSEKKWNATYHPFFDASVKINWRDVESQEEFGTAELIALLQSRLMEALEEAHSRRGK